MLTQSIKNNIVLKKFRLSLLSAILLSMTANADDNSASKPPNHIKTSDISSPAQDLLNKKLLNAAIAEDFEQVKNLMSKGAQTTLKHAWKDYHTPLTAALASGFAPIAHYMLEHELSEPTERTLFYAARLGDVSIVQTVLDRLSKGEFKNGQRSRLKGRCELTEAVKYNRFEVVKLLYPLQLKYCGNSINTAIGEGHLSLAKWLIDKLSEDVKANIANNQYWMSSAFDSGNVEMIRFVQSLGIKLNGDGQLDHYLQTAATNNQLAILKYLKNQGYDFDNNPNVYSNILTSAIRGGSTSVVDYFIEQGMRLDKPGACNPPLHQTVRLQQAELFFKLAKLNTPQIDPCNQQNPLHVATSKGALSANKFLLDYNPSWRLAKDAEGNIPLHHILQTFFFGAEYDVATLIKFGGRNQQNLKGQTPLMLAMSSQNSQLHKPILSADSDLSLQDAQGKTALHYLAERWGSFAPEDYKGFFSVLSKAQLNAQDFAGFTGLSTAISHRNPPELIAHLLKLGANPNIKNKAGENAFDLAKEHGDKKVLSLLGLELPENLAPEETKTASTQTESKNSAPQQVPKPLKLADFPNMVGNTALHAAVRLRSLLAVNYALENKIPLNTPNQYGDTALQLAVKLGETRLVERLLAMGANIHTKNRDGRTPLHSAIANKRFPIAQQLLAKKANINALSRGGWTPLHYAATSGNLALVSELLARGAQPNVKNWGDSIPAMLAEKANHKALAVVLVKATQSQVDKPNTSAVDTEHKADYGNNPLLQAVLDLDIAEVTKRLTPERLNQPDIYHETPLTLAIWGANKDLVAADAIVQLLLKPGANPNTINPLGGNALHVAIQQKVPNAIIKRLLDAGVDIEHRDNVGFSPILQATQLGNTQLVDWLITRQPELINSRTSQNTSLLYLAVWQNHPELAQLLIQKGIEINDPFLSDYSLLYAALNNKRPKLFKILVEAGADLKAHSADFPSLVLSAAQSKQFELLDYLLDKGAELDPLETDEPAQLLSALAANGNAASALLDKVLETYQLLKIPGFVDAHQDTLLNQLIRQDADQLLIVYENHGLQLPIKRVLHLAAASDAINSFKYLAAKVTDLNQLDDDANSLLHSAVKEQSSAVTQWLAQKNPDTTLRNQRGLTAMDYLGVYTNTVKSDAFPKQFLKLFPNASYSPELLKNIIDLELFSVARLLLEQYQFPVKENSESLIAGVTYSSGSAVDRVALLSLLLDNGASLPKPILIAPYLNNNIDQPALFNFLLSKTDQDLSEASQWEVLRSLITSNEASSLTLLKSLQAKGWNLQMIEEQSSDNLFHILNKDYYSDKAVRGLALKKYDFLVKQLSLPDYHVALNHSNKRGKTPLQLTFENQRLYQSVPELFYRQLPAAAKHKKPLLTEAYWMFQRSNQETLKQLLQLPSLNAEFLNLGLANIIQAAGSSSDIIEMFPVLLSAGADAKAINQQGHTLAHRWMLNHCRWINGSGKDSECLKGLQYLKTLKVDLGAIDHEKISPLYLALDGINGDNLPIVTFLLAEGVSPNIHLKSGQTPLHLAATGTQSQQRLLLKNLLLAGADINAQNAQGDTPLHLALRAKNSAGVSYLLNAGKLKNSTNKRQQTPLHELVKQRNIDWLTRYLTILAQQGEDISQVDTQGNTALHLVALQPCEADACAVNAKMARLLITSGLDPDMPNKNNETAFFMSAYSGNLPLAKYLLTKTLPSVINQLNKVGNAAVHVAYYQQHTAFLEWLLSHGGDWELKNWEGQSIQQLMVKNQDYALALLAQSLPISVYDWREGLESFDLSEENLESLDLLYSMMDQRRLAVTQLPIPSLEAMAAYRHKSNENSLLHIAAKHNYLITLKQLLNANHPVDWLNDHKRTALHLAVSGATPIDITRALLAHGAGPNTQDAQGISPFLSAVRTKQIDTVKAMLKAGAKLELSDLKQRTALLVAVETGQLDMVKLLLKKGANIKTSEASQHTPLIHAVWYYVTQMNSDPKALNDRIALIDLLLANGATMDERDELQRTPLHIAMPIYELAQHLLSKGAKADILNANQESPFFQAIRTRYPNKNDGIDFIRALAKAGADVNEKNKNDVTPLHLAVSNDRLDLLPTLIELGADVNIRIRGVPLISHLITQPYSNKQALINLLLKYSLDLNVHDNIDGLKGKTPLHYAIEKGDLSLVLFLLENGSDPNLLDKNGMNALHTSASLSLDSLQTDQLLSAMLKAKLDINAVDYDNRTALHHAALSRNLHLTKTLLAKGVNPNAQNISDNTALSSIILRGRDNAGFQQLIDLLIKVTDLNSRDVLGRTALHWAYYAKNKALIEQLVAAGIDVTIRDYGGRLAQETR